MNVEFDLDKMKAFQMLLDAEPEHVERHDDGYDYIPVSAIEDKLAEIFNGLFNISIKSSEAMFNAVKYDVRISYYHPVANVWIDRDGAGAVSIFANRILEGTDVAKLQPVNTPEMATPLAYAEAIKNAAKKIGKVFGADLNRDFDSKSRKAKPSAFDVIPFDAGSITTIHEAKKAFTAQHITYKRLKELESYPLGEDGKICYPEVSETTAEKKAAIKKTGKK